MDQLTLGSAVDERVANDIDGALKGPKEYKQMWDKYNKQTGGKMPAELTAQDGSMLPFGQFKKQAPGFKKRTLNTMEHKRAKELAQLRANAAASRASQYTQSPDTPNQRVSAFNSYLNWSERTETNLGDPREAGTDAAWLIGVLANTPNAVARMESEGGEGTNEETVRHTILQAASDHISNKKDWWWEDDTEFDQDGFLRVVDKKLGLAGGTFRQFIDTPEIKKAIDKEGVPEFATEAEAAKAAAAKKINVGDSIIINGVKGTWE